MFDIRLKAKPEISFSVITIIGILMYFNFDNIKSKNFDPEIMNIIFGAVLVVFSIYCIWSFFGMLVLRINNGNLLIQYFILGIPFYKRSFKLFKIKDIQILEHQPSWIYWSSGGLNINKYDRTIMVFKYNNKTIKFGKTLRSFDGYLIKEKINKITPANTL